MSKVKKEFVLFIFTRFGILAITAGFIPQTSPSGTDRDRNREPCEWSKRWDDVNAANPEDCCDGLAPPNKVKHVDIDLPDSDVGHSGGPLLEAVVERDGTIHEVKLIRGFKRPWPEAEENIKNAIRQWEYEPVRIDGTAVPVCMTISITICWM